jgi:hypothetical protein
MKQNSKIKFNIFPIMQVLRHSIMKEYDTLKYPDAHYLDHLCSYYIDKMMESVKHKGKGFSAKLFKDLNLISQCIASQRPFERLRFFKSDKRGIPKILKPLLPLLESDSPNLKRYALTITRQYTCLYLEPIFNELPITGDPISIIPDTDMQSYNDWVQSSTFLPKYQPEFNVMSPFDLNLSTSTGPNGPALMTSHMDAIALENNREILYWFERLNIQTNTSWLNEYRMTCCKYSGSKVLVLGRISLIAEGGGKTRTIAIGNFWIQSALKGIHNKIMGILSKIKTDGTYAQDDQAQRIVRESFGHSVYCYDLSNATDRFPIILQIKILNKIFGEDIGCSWGHIMSDIPYSYNNKEYKWKVGQPLGLLSSWAVFTLTHHSVVRYCASLEGLNNFEDYAILGDDIVIWNHGVADRYYRFMEINGVSINLSKSVISTCAPYTIEFAKRLFYNGSEISGLTYDIMKSGMTPLGYVQFYHYCLTRGWDLTGDLFLSGLSLKWRDILTFIINVKVLGMCALQRVNTLTADQVKAVRRSYMFHRLDSINYKVKNTRDCLTTNKFVDDKLSVGGFTPDQAQIGTRVSIFHWHPIIIKIMHLRMAHSGLIEELYYINSMNNSDGDGELPPLHEIEYVPDPSGAPYFGDRKLMRSKKMTQLLAKVLESIREEIPETLYRNIQIKSEDLNKEFVIRGLKSHPNNLVCDEIPPIHINVGEVD